MEILLIIKVTDFKKYRVGGVVYFIISNFTLKVYDCTQIPSKTLSKGL